jgi:hypothetical protein
MLFRIVDIMLNVKLSDGTFVTQAFYNNYLYQNYFFIKGYGTNGFNTSSGTLVPGVSFYWINSVNNGKKVTCISQTIQTAYDSLQMPYVLNGLGRANNYV